MAMCYSCCSCRTRSASCVCAFVVFHVILAVTLMAALFTRLYIYQDEIRTDMPSDMRVFHNNPNSVFCSRHTIRSTILDKGSLEKKEQDKLNSNTIPRFDFYEFTQDPTCPKANLSIRRELYNLQSTNSLLKLQYEYHNFRLMNDSSVKLGICVQPVDNTAMTPLFSNDTGLYVYFIKGENRFNDIIGQMESGKWQIPCNSGSGNCPFYRKIPPTTELHCYPQNYTEFKQHINDTDDYYFVFYNPNTKLAGLHYVLRYDLNRTQYDLSNYVKKPNTKLNTNDQTAKPDDYLILHFNYSRNFSANRLYNIEVTYMCEPDVLVYMGVFFFAPILILVVFSVVFFCCYQRRMAKRQMLMDTASDSHRWGNEYHASSHYGSTEAVYT